MTRVSLILLAFKYKQAWSVRAMQNYLSNAYEYYYSRDHTYKLLNYLADKLVVTKKGTKRKHIYYEIANVNLVKRVSKKLKLQQVNNKLSEQSSKDSAVLTRAFNYLSTELSNEDIETVPKRDLRIGITMPLSTAILIILLDEDRSLNDLLIQLFFSYKEEIDNTVEKTAVVKVSLTSLMKDKCIVQYGLQVKGRGRRLLNVGTYSLTEQGRNEAVRRFEVLRRLLDGE